MPCRDIRTNKTLAVVIAIDKSDDLAKAGFLGEPDFTPSDRCFRSSKLHHHSLTSNFPSA